MTQAPDFVEALAGYRAWNVDEHGRLMPVSFGSSWDAGVNRASCSMVERHSAPQRGCSCGFHAFHDVDNRGLREDRTYAVGAVAAWGDIDIFRTGFRAEFACVVALAYFETTTIRHYRSLQLAATRYKVELVDISQLRGEALKYARPLPAGELPVVERRKPKREAGGGVRRSPCPAKAPAAAPRRQTAITSTPTPTAPPWATATPGFCVDAHLLLSPGSKGAVLSPTPAFAAAIGKPDAIRFSAEGSKVRAGEVVASVRTGSGSFAVVSPVDAELVGLNERLARKPGLFSPQEWVVRVKGTGSSFGGGMVLWGEDGWRSYRRYVSTREDARIRRELALDAHLPLEIGSPSELRRRLRERRERLQAIPGFLTEPGRLAWLADTLDEELGKDELLQNALREESIDLAIDIVGAEEAMVVESNGEKRPQIVLRPAPADATIRLNLDAEALHSFWTGELDLARLTREQAAVSGARHEALRITSLVRRLCPKYADRVRPVLAARRKAWQELSSAGRWWVGEPA